ncbi:MAG: PIN domain-containing protein [Firmicutes bacterium]|nr:PIN domain-containing protein [Bacillota bacterium]
MIRKGINIPENDLWIAATAIANNLKLATFDHHFTHIDGLEVVY